MGYFDPVHNVFDNNNNFFLGVILTIFRLKRQHCLTQVAYGALAIASAIIVMEDGFVVAEIPLGLLNAFSMISVMRFAAVLIVGIVPLLSLEVSQHNGVSHVSLASDQSTGRQSRAFDNIIHRISSLPSCLSIGPVSIPCLLGLWPFSGEPRHASYLLPFMVRPLPVVSVSHQ